MCEECSRTKALLVDQLVALKNNTYPMRANKSRKMALERFRDESNKMDITDLIEEIRYEAWQIGVDQGKIR